MTDRLHKPRTEDTSPQRLTADLRTLAEAYGAYPGISSDLRRLLLAPSPGSPDGREVSG